MATQTLDPQKNKDLCRSYVQDVINQHNPDASDRYFDANCTDDTLPPGMPPGLEGIKQGYREIFRGFPDAHLELHELVAEGDKVAMRFTFTGTHRGEFLGIPATNKRVEVDGCEFDEIRNGKIVRVNGTVNMLKMLGQVDAVQVPGRLANV